MAIRMAMSGWYLDDSMDAGQVLKEGRDLYLTAQTWRDLMRDTRCGQVRDALHGLPDGLYPVPLARPRLLDTEYDPEAAAELMTALLFVDRGPSTFCAFPPCVLPAAAAVDGYHLCEHHQVQADGFRALLPT